MTRPVSISNATLTQLVSKLFEDRLSTSDLASCIDRGETLCPPARKEFWKSTSDQAGVYLVLEGRIRLIDSQEEQLASIGIGESFGEPTLFPQIAYAPFSARATRDAPTLLFLSASFIQELCREDAQITELLTVKALKFQEQVQEHPTITLMCEDESVLKVVPQPSDSAQDGKAENKIYEAQVPAPRQTMKHWWQRSTRRYPFVAQQSASDCGIASIVMVALYYGKRLSMTRVRGMAKVNQDGASMNSLVMTVESLGFMARPCQGSLQELANQTLPAIAHWEGNHYIVVYQITEKQVIVADPAVGQRSLTYKEFQVGWTGYILLLQPARQWEQRSEDKPSLAQFLTLLIPHQLVLSEVIITSILIQIIGLVNPWFTQMILDVVINQKSLTTLTAMGCGLIIFGIFQILLTTLRKYLLDHTANRIDMALIVAFIHHTFRLPLQYFESRHVGDIISRVQENQKIQKFLTDQALSILMDLLTLFIYIGLMFWYSWKLALLTLAIVPPYTLITFLATPSLRRISRQIFSADNTSTGYLIQSLTGIRTVKAMAVEQTVRWKWENHFSALVKTKFSGQMIGSLLQSISAFIKMVLTTALLWLGAWQVINNELTPGQLIAFNMLVGNVISPFERLIGVWDEFQEVMIAVERLNDVLEEAPEEPTSIQYCQHTLSGRITFEHVTFRYHAESSNILENVNFTTEPGQMVAIVGRSGSGKTTLTKLLLGLYKPTEGNIFIDEQNINTISLRSLRQQIGVVDQDTFMFGGTIRENLCLASPDVTLDQMIEAAQLAGAHGFIDKLPMKYETQIGEGGGMLSGGQRQRLAIARALLGNPRLLIFDEATSHLDTESERVIQNNLNEILKNRTTFVIAHRLSTVQKADLILVLNQGQIVEKGTHSDLMSNCHSLYFHLNQQQLQSPV
jgi:ATP-binding cassette, subfamily B, bacterial HlyB/CyaB